jgi:peroxiredoxin
LEEIPDLSALHREFGPRGLQLIAVAMSYDPPNLVLEAIRNRKLEYAVALDPLGEAAKSFGQVRLVPNTFLIDPKGRIELHRLGKIDVHQLRPRIAKMLEPS